MALVTLLSTAGNETTARHIGWAGATLARYPDQRAKLVAHPELIPNAVEEILRFEPPSMCLARVPTTDVVWYDQVVPAGAVLVVINAATGRDQRQFPDPDPDTLNVERRIDRHLSFGFGAHVCLGASLARLESRIALEEMLETVPRMGRRLGPDRDRPHRQRRTWLLQASHHLWVILLGRPPAPPVRRVGCEHQEPDLGLTKAIASRRHRRPDLAPSRGQQADELAIGIAYHDPITHGGVA